VSVHGAGSKYGADIKATTDTFAIGQLFAHRLALDPRTVKGTHLTVDRLLEANFRSAFTTLLYLVARKLGAMDWQEANVRVGVPLDTGPWQFHHIFPDETFFAERATLRDAIEAAQSEGDEKKVQRLQKERDGLEARIASVGNLAFLTPASNQSISNRSPIDYLPEIAATPEGRAALEAQLIPLDRELWKHTSFEAFRQRRCELIIEKASELFFSEWREAYVWSYASEMAEPSPRTFWSKAGDHS
jgi:hypothetical protein